MEKAMQLQQTVNRIREIMHLSNSVISMHAMLQARGIDGGLPRRPLLPADEGLVARIKAE
jgi:dihydrodipicolinate synthase/N-acetylneuraminate lyase